MGVRRFKFLRALFLAGAAGRAVAAIPDEQALAALVARLGAAEVSDRQAAYAALLSAGAEDPGPVLERLPADLDDMEVQAACQRLRERIPVENRRRRMRALAQTVEAGTVIDDFFDAPSRQALLSLLKAIPSEGKGDAVRLLTVFLGSDDPHLRRDVVLAVAKHAPGEIDTVRPLLRDPDPSVRAWVLVALWRMGDPAIPPRLLDFLAGDSRPERGVAEYILKKTGAVWETSRIGALLDHRDPGVRAAALRVLGEFGTPEARALVAARLSGEDRDLEALDAVIEFFDDPGLDGDAGDMR